MRERKKYEVWCSSYLIVSSCKRQNFVTYEKSSINFRIRFLVELILCLDGYPKLALSTGYTWNFFNVLWFHSN